MASPTDFYRFPAQSQSVLSTEKTRNISECTGIRPLHNSHLKFYLRLLGLGLCWDCKKKKVLVPVLFFFHLKVVLPGYLFSIKPRLWPWPGET